MSETIRPKIRWQHVTNHKNQKLNWSCQLEGQNPAGFWGGVMAQSIESNSGALLGALRCQNNNKTWATWRPLALVFRCFQMFSDVFRCFQMFSETLRILFFYIRCIGCEVPHVPMCGKRPHRGGRFDARRWESCQKQLCQKCGEDVFMRTASWCMVHGTAAVQPRKSLLVLAASWSKLDVSSRCSSWLLYKLSNSLTPHRSDVGWIERWRVKAPVVVGALSVETNQYQRPDPW